jgi:hypothetical protein
MEFLHFVTGIYWWSKYLSQIGSGDKIAFFLYASLLYCKFQREKQVAMKTTGYETLHVTPMLCITANNNKLPLYVILNRKTVKKQNFCKDVIVWAKKMHGWH